MDVDGRGRPSVKVGDGTLGLLIRGAPRAVGEPLRWGISPADVAGYLQQRGFRALEQAPVGDLRARWLAPAGLREEPLANYEHLALAQPA